MEKFADISHWDKLLNSDISGIEGGIIIKATEGATYNDTQMNNFYSFFVGKIPIGFYHFLTVFTSPIKQAQHFWNKIKNKNFSIIPVVDVEQLALSYKAERFTEHFIKEFKNLSGITPLIYSGEYFIKEHFSTTFISSYNFWVANYSAKQIPNIPNCNITAWQYTDKAKLNFCKKVDLSYLIKPSLFYVGENKKYKENKGNYNIATLQAELNRQGFRDAWGDKLQVDGVAGRRTLTACPTVRLNAHGGITKWIQEKVGTRIDGYYGKNTLKKVKEFQKQHDIVSDGIVGKATWKKLLKI